MLGLYTHCKTKPNRSNEVQQVPAQHNLIPLGSTMFTQGNVTALCTLPYQLIQQPQCLHYTVTILKNSGSHPFSEYLSICQILRMNVRSQNVTFIPALVGTIIFVMNPRSNMDTDS